MSRIITAVCDKHFREGEHVEPTEEVPFEINGDKFLLEVCAACYKGWFLPLKEELLEIAVPRNRNGKPLAPVVPAPRIKRTRCEIPGCTSRVNAEDARAMVTHIRQRHPDEYPDWKAARDAARNGGQVG